LFTTTGCPVGGLLCVYAGHDQPLGGASPVWRLMASTRGRGQLRRRVAGWEGGRRRNGDLRDTNRIRGGAVGASQHAMAKPDVIKRPKRKCGGCAGRWLVLSREISAGVARCSVGADAPFAGWDVMVAVERLLLAVEKSAEAVVAAGLMVVGKGRTRSRAPGRSCSWPSQ